MTPATDDQDRARLADLVVISAAAVAEVALAHPGAVLDCEGWPTAAELIQHLGQHFGWVVAAVGADERPRHGEVPTDLPIASWFEGERDRFVEVLSSHPPDSPAWTFSGPRVLRFWYRRSIFEVGRHVWDLRTAGGYRPEPPPELSPGRYADGVTEHFDVFLARSREQLERLPAALQLRAIDVETSWTIAPDWQVLRDDVEPGAVIEATAGELALLCWERADALADPKFGVSGDEAVVRAFQSAPIHR